MNQYLVKKQFKKSKQIGRGYGSKKGGHTSTKGTKGQKSRTGYNAASRMFEGSQMPLYRRLPVLKGLQSMAFAKPNRGFERSRENNLVVSSSVINSKYTDSETVNISTLKEKGLIKTKQNKRNKVKILFKEEINKPLTIEGIEVSAKVKASIEKAGGSVK